MSGSPWIPGLGRVSAAAGWHPRWVGWAGGGGIPGGLLPWELKALGDTFLGGPSKAPLMTHLHSPPQPSQRCALLWASKPFIRTLTALPSECFSESRVSLQGPRAAGLLSAFSRADNFACFNSLDPRRLPVREALLCLHLKCNRETEAQSGQGSLLSSHSPQAWRQPGSTSTRAAPVPHDLSPTALGSVCLHVHLFTHSMLVTAGQWDEWVSGLHLLVFFLF